jgi:hypothetical protein
MRSLALLAATALPLAACFFGADDTAADASLTAPDARIAVDADDSIDARPPGPCNDHAFVVSPPTGVHVAEGTTVTYPTNPPSGGPHYPVWVKWDATYDPGVARPYYVHNTEHGGVVLLYNCPAAGGCPAVVQQLQALQASLPHDTLCMPPQNTRTLITADPLLPASVQVAASAWGAYYTAECFDEPSLRAFIDAHYGHAPEATCAQGSVP